MKATHLVEPLEARIAPATLVNPTTVTYIDEDGDTVVVKTTRGAFDLSDFTFRDIGGGEQLQLLELDPTDFKGAHISIKVTKRGAEGDGLVNVGHLSADGTSLASVKINGDLGKITVGDSIMNPSEPSLGLLKVRSMGLYGTATQEAGANLKSVIAHDLGKLVVLSDMRDVNFDVGGDLVSIMIGGSLIGTDATLAFGGSIECLGDIGVVKIGRDIVGGLQSNSGGIDSAGGIGSVTIGGAVIGGLGILSGVIRAKSGIGPIKIGQDLIGGAGISSGLIISEGDVASVTIGGSILGGTGIASGSVSSGREIGPVKVGMNVIGVGPSSGQISGSGGIGNVTIGGSLIGLEGAGTALILSDGDIGVVKIGGNVKGGSGGDSGKIAAGGSIAGIRIGGSLLGGDGHYDGLGPLQGQIVALGPIGAISIGGNVHGGDGRFSGAISSAGDIASVNVGGSLIGGDGGNSGLIGSAGSLGLVTIKHDVHGGVGDASGAIFSGQDGKGITIGGSLIGGDGFNSGFAGSSGASTVEFVKIGSDFVGGTGPESGAIENSINVIVGGSVVGGTGDFSGYIFSERRIDSIVIGHDLIGASITDNSETPEGSGFIEGEEGIGSITIGGSIIAGTDASTLGDLRFNASIQSEGGIDSLTVKGGLIGNRGSKGDTFVIIAANRAADPNATENSVIGKISIGGRVEFAQILAGYNIGLDAENPDAQIGTVKVGGDWIASSIVVGAINLGADDALGGSGPNADNVNFGDDHDGKIPGTDSAAIISRIGSIQIAGEVFGTPTAIGDSDSYGFVAEEIGSVRIGERRFTLEEGAGNDAIRLGLDRPNLPSDFAAHEVDAPFDMSTPSEVPAAKLINPRTIVYTDSDGDRVTVKLSKPLLNEGNVNDVFTFDHGIVGGDDSLPQQLQLIDLSILATDGVGVSVTVKRGGGDGLAQIGRIGSGNFNMGHVNIDGDLGSIRGGASTDELGLLSLTVRSYGRYGTDTQSAASLPAIGGEINGGIGSLRVKQDVVGANIDVTGGIGSIAIGGSLIGGFSINSGVIFATGFIGSVKIGGHLQGGRNTNAGAIVATTGIGPVSIGGSLIGGEGLFTGVVSGVGAGSFKITHNLIGGGGDSSGRIIAAGRVFAIGGSVLGGVGNDSATIESEDAIASVKIGHNIVGRQIGSGLVTAESLDRITIGGSLMGGEGTASGLIETLAGDMGVVKIRHDLRGGSGDESGKIRCLGESGSMLIGGSLIGGSGRYDTILDPDGFEQEGQIFIRDNVATIKIGMDVIGGKGETAGSIVCVENTDRIIIGGSIVGGAGRSTGAIASNDVGVIGVAFDLFGGNGEASGGITMFRFGSVALGGSVIGGSESNTGIITALQGDAIKVAGDVVGGSAFFSGILGASGGSLGKVVVEGSLVGGRESTTGIIFASNGVGSVKIGHHLIGSSIVAAGDSLDATGAILSGRFINNVSIGGSMIGGWDASSSGDLTSNASIVTSGNIGTLSVAGSLLGNVTATGGGVPRIIALGTDLLPGESDEFTIRKLTVGGRVDHAQILAGYSLDAKPINGNASIGAVKVKGDWIASDLVAGAKTETVPIGVPKSFGDSDDVPINAGESSRIASVTIKGLAVGSSEGGDHFGFVAGQIGAFKALGSSASGSIELLELSTITGDMSVRAV